MIDWTGIARAMLAEVGLTFDDVYDLGRHWGPPPPGFVFKAKRPIWRGIMLPPNHDNQTARQRPLIGLSGPVDCEKMLSVLAHECGHVHDIRWVWSSIPEYELEYAAELYMIAAFERHLGRLPHPWIVASAKRYVRYHCWRRYHSVGPEPTKGWRREVVDWCGFNPPKPLELR